MLLGKIYPTIFQAFNLVVANKRVWQLNCLYACSTYPHYCGKQYEIIKIF